MPPSRNGKKPQRDNFTMIPNIVGAMDLNPYEFRLYYEIKMRAGDDDVSWQTTEALAKACNMSEHLVVRSKRRLIKLELISLSPHKNGSHEPHLIKVAEIWHKNHALYHQAHLDPSDATPSILGWWISQRWTVPPLHHRTGQIQSLRCTMCNGQSPPLHHRTGQIQSLRCTMCNGLLRKIPLRKIPLRKIPL